MTKQQSIGALFKATREKKGLSIEKIHQDTKMLPMIIAAMEEDAFDKIGAKAYQESFLKKYARYLGLDASGEITSALKESAAAPQANSITAGILNKKVTAEEAPPRWIVPAVIMAVSIAAVVFLGIILLGRILHTGGVHAESVKGKKVQAAAKAVSEIKPISFGSKDERLRLALYAKDDVWVKVRSDGKVISQGVLTKGSKEMLEANNRFNIWTGKVEALSFSVNNRQLDIKGKGVVKDIRITHDGIEMRR